jgi:hypothetical protein
VPFLIIPILLFQYFIPVPVIVAKLVFLLSLNSILESGAVEDNSIKVGMSPRLVSGLEPFSGVLYAEV